MHGVVALYRDYVRIAAVGLLVALPELLVGPDGFPS